MKTTQIPTALGEPDRLDRMGTWARRLAHAYEELAALAEDAPLLDADLQESTQALAQHAASVLAQARRVARSEHAVYEGAACAGGSNRIDRLFADLPPRTFGQRVRRLRLERGLTQKELAQQVGVDWRQVQRWEGDARRPRPAALSRLAAALQVAVADLFARGVPPS